MAQVAAERLDQMQDPELSIEQAMKDYKRLGYSDNWINQHLKIHCTHCTNHLIVCVSVYFWCNAPCFGFTSIASKK